MCIASSMESKTLKTYPLDFNDFMVLFSCVIILVSRLVAINFMLSENVPF